MKSFVLRICAFVLLVCLSFSGCATSGGMNFQKMNITAKYKSGKILNLRNYGDFYDSALKQSEKIMKSGFLNTATDEYGYYEIDWGYKFDSEESGLANIFVLLVSPIIFPFWFVGVPLGSNHFTVVTNLRIFDSNGKLVWQDKGETKVKQIYGFYYGDATAQGARKISKLLTDQLAKAAKDAEKINAALELAGTITNANSGPALEKIAAYDRK